MTRYVAFLRAINVGGRTVKMERLRKLFEDLGLKNVRSYINSGNIFFETEVTDRQELAHSIEQHLRKKLGFDVPTFLRTTVELETILQTPPFYGAVPAEDERFCVVFTKEILDKGMQLPQHTSKKDMEVVALNPYEAFVVWRIINGRPPSGKFPTSTLPALNTTRFFHTLAKILQAALKDV